MECIHEYSLSLFNRSPKLSLCNAEGVSKEDVSKLQNELQCMAANLVGEVHVKSELQIC